MKEGHFLVENRGLWCVLCILVLAIVGLSVGVGVVIGRGGEAEEVGEAIEIDGEITTVDDENMQDAIEKIADVNTKIEVTNDNAEKAVLYIDLARRLFDEMDSTGTDNQQQILEAVHTAYDLEQNLDTAYNVYLYEYTFGNEAEAAKYREIAVGYGLPENPKGRG